MSTATEHRTTVQLFGTAGAVPEIGGDSASFLINGKYLVDTGWSAVANLRGVGVDPLELKYVFFTHFHHDHYLSLPSLLFYLLMRGKPLRELNIVGPAEDLEPTVRRAMDFLHAERFFAADEFPNLVPLSPGDSYEVGDFRLDTCATIHPVQGLCYRFTDRISGSVVSFTGDTAYHPPIADHVRCSALLLHEASLGPIAADPSNNDYMHAGALDAARIAQDAEVGKLVLLHGAASRAEACVQAARTVFDGEVEWPSFGQVYTI